MRLQKLNGHNRKKDCWDIVQADCEYHLPRTSKAATGSTQWKWIHLGLAKANKTDLFSRARIVKSREAEYCKSAKSISNIQIESVCECCREENCPVCLASKMRIWVRNTGSKHSCFIYTNICLAFIYEQASEAVECLKQEPGVTVLVCRYELQGKGKQRSASSTSSSDQHHNVGSLVQNRISPKKNFESLISSVA